MPDREKVLKGLECCLNIGDCQKQCDYFHDNFCQIKLMRDAFKLLKAQEQIVRCKDCKHLITLDYNGHYYCPKTDIECGANIADWFCASAERRDE